MVRRGARLKMLFFMSTWAGLGGGFEVGISQAGGGFKRENSCGAALILSNGVGIIRFRWSTRPLATDLSGTTTLTLCRWPRKLTCSGECEIPDVLTRTRQ